MCCVQLIVALVAVCEVRLRCLNDQSTERNGFSRATEKGTLSDGHMIAKEPVNIRPKCFFSIKATDLVLLNLTLKEGTWWHLKSSLKA